MTDTPDDSEKARSEHLNQKIRVMAGAAETARTRFFAESTPAVARAAEMIVNAIRGGGKLLIFGNGGSAADAQHIAAELTFRMGRLRRALPAIALTTDTSVLTAIANDRSFDQVFVRQIEALGRERDVALAISTSGNSINIVEAVKQAREMGITTIGLLGVDGGAVGNLVDLALIVRHSDTPRIQETHIVIAHIICQLIEDELFPED
ncbi:MAG: D-sedoheptulose 7-phosphate isomerase [Acidobacteriota bacterium]